MLYLTVMIFKDVWI